MIAVRSLIIRSNPKPRRTWCTVAVAVCALGWAAPSHAQTALLPTGPAPRPSARVVGDVVILDDGLLPGEEFVFDPYQNAWRGDTWQLLPDGLIYRSYLAGTKEPRISGTVAYETDVGWLLDVALGGRVGLIRYGTSDDEFPEGWQLDIEGAAFPRLDLKEEWDMLSADFRFGVPLTYGSGKWRFKAGYYHLSSHLGDELMIREPATVASRINFSRDVLVVAASYYPNPSMRLYGEAGWAFASDGGSRPWEFQFGLEYVPVDATTPLGAPFLAINAHLREEIDFGGPLVVEAGWVWRGSSGYLLRTGLYYLNGPSNQFQFFGEAEQQIGAGLWYDF